MPKPTVQQTAAEAQRLLRLGRFRRALALTTPLHHALPLAPPIAALHAEALLQVGMPRRAAEVLDPAIPHARTPQEAAAMLVQRAAADTDLGRTEDAVEHLRSALRTRPGWTEATAALGERLIDLGRLDEAHQVLRSETDQPDPPHFSQPVDPATALTFARLCRRRNQTDLAIATLEGILASPNPAGHPDAWFMLGACREQLGDHPGAFEAYRNANRALEKSPGAGKSIDPQAWESRALDALRTPTPENATDAPGNNPHVRPNNNPQPKDLPDQQVILIAGVPRSGTSLVEQIFASHPKVGACGESQALPWVVSRLGPGGMGLERARSVYREELAAAASRADAAVLTDKNPMNLFLLGMARGIIPGVRVIRVRRDPRDVCLSCFASPLKADHGYARDLADCRRFIESADRVMDAAAGVFGADWHEVVYEDLVRDPEPVIRGMLAHAGLGFDPRCLHPEHEGRVTRTISRDQVRSGITDASVGRWRRFAEHFGDWPAD